MPEGRKSMQMIDNGALRSSNLRGNTEYKKGDGAANNQ